MSMDINKYLEIGISAKCAFIVSAFFILRFNPYRKRHRPSKPLIIKVVTNNAQSRRK